ncbi:MAG: UDP-glucose 4-epimerase GalE [Bacteroidia bacterium]|jgi:UDP-glucose 4-epimerase|nr:MAG: UDP-glucose 4-epimerase GalE [Bacteroidia bacterium]
MIKILVTGGTGYIGSHTVVELQEEGMEVVIIDNLSNSEREVLSGISSITGKEPHFEEMDLRDEKATFGVFERHPDIDAIIHFAAFKAVGESVEKALEYYENNLFSLIHLMKAMRKYRVDHMVFSSSCTVYGEPDVLPVTEDAPIKKANSPYGNTKQICEEILQDSLASMQGKGVISLRYFNPIGAHESALIGELPVGVPNNLVPFITQTAAGLRECLSVYGDDYNTSDGSAVRDYINVVDLAKAHVASIRRLLNQEQKSQFEVFNLGTGKGLSVFEVIKAFERSTGQSLNYKVVGRREGDIEKMYADTSYANSELGWKAEKGIDETLRSAWKWEQKIRAQKSE